APVVASDPPDGIVIGTEGADHLLGGEDVMLADMLNRIAASGFAVRGAIADSWGAAHALARYRQEPRIVIPKGKTTHAISHLPIAALRVASETVAGLRVLGFDHIGDLLTAPR